MVIRPYGCNYCHQLFKPTSKHSMTQYTPGTQRSWSSCHTAATAATCCSSLPWSTAYDTVTHGTWRSWSSGHTAAITATCCSGLPPSMGMPQWTLVDTWEVMVIRSYSCNYSHLLSKPTPKYTMKQCHLALEGHGHHVIQLQQYTATWCSSLPPEHTIIHGHIWHVNIHTLRKCSVLSPPCQFWWTAIICVKFNFYLFV